MKPHEIAEHLATNLRHTIGPAVADPFARTQAFMASVVLEKLAGQLRVAEADERAARRDAVALTDDLRALDVAPSAVRFLAAVRRLDTGSDARVYQTRRLLHGSLLFGSTTTAHVSPAHELSGSSSTRYVR